MAASCETCSFFFFFVGLGSTIFSADRLQCNGSMHIIICTLIDPPIELYQITQSLYYRILNELLGAQSSDRPVARGVQTGAIAPPPPTGCKVRFAGYEYYSLYCAIYTYINKNCHVHDRVHVRALVRDQFGLWLDQGPPRKRIY